MNKTTHAAGKVMALAMIFAVGTLGAYATEPSVKEHIVEITGFKFVPETIDVVPGDTITWVNLDIVPHTATANDGSWDTGLLSTNESKSVMVGPNMASGYICRFHATMTGTVALANRVESAGS